MLRRFQGMLKGEPKTVTVGSTPTGPGALTLSGYARDCVISGQVHLAAERLSDMLNDEPTILFRDVTVVALADGHVVELTELEVGRDELVGVSVAGPRGNDGRRRTTREVPVAMALGPYRVWGFIHSPPTADPLSTLMGHRLMVPLTGVTVLYERDGQPQLDTLDGLIVSRDAVDSVNEPLQHLDAQAATLDAQYGIHSERGRPEPAESALPEETY